MLEDYTMPNSDNGCDVRLCIHSHQFNFPHILLWFLVLGTSCMVACHALDTQWTRSLFFLNFLFNLGRSFSVQHCFPMMPRVEFTNSHAAQELPWSELTERSLSSNATAPQVKWSNGTSSGGNNFLDSTGTWTGDPLHHNQRLYVIVMSHPLCELDRDIFNSRILYILKYRYIVLCTLWSYQHFLHIFIQLTQNILVFQTWQGMAHHNHICEAIMPTP